MKTNPLIILTLLFPFISNAQEEPSVSKNLFSINILIPSLEYETALSQNSTLDLALGTAFGLAGGELRGGTDFGFYPTFSSQYRYYYNLGRRMEKGKKVSENSGNYIAAMASVRSGNPIFGDLETVEDFAGFIGPIWGMHRIYNGDFKLDLHLGVGYGFNDLGDSYFSPLIGIRLGWLLAK